MNSQERRQIAAPLASRVREGASAREVAAAVVEICHDINGALTPIVGKEGTAALFKRSLYLTGTAFPWMRGGGVQTVLDPSGLEEVLVAQDAGSAMAAASALLNSFHELLTSLIGPMLTERLLRSVWTPALNSRPAQDSIS